MARFRLPAEFADGLRPLLGLPLDVVQGLCAELESLSIKLAIEEDVAERVDGSKFLPNQSKDEKSKIAEAIVRLHLLRHTSNKTSGTVIDDVINTFDASDSLVARPSALREALQAVLDIKSIQSSIKSWTLVDDYDQIYLSSRIITDVRPVFDDDLAGRLRASLITHSIRLTVRNDGRPKQVYIVADSMDLKELKAGIDRALEKAAALTRMVKGHPDRRFGASLEDETPDE